MIADYRFGVWYWMLGVLNLEIGVWCLVIRVLDLHLCAMVIISLIVHVITIYYIISLVLLRKKQT